MLKYAPHDIASLADEGLVLLLRTNHDWALKEIFTRYHLKLFRLAVGVVKDDEVAKDLVQEIFVDLWRRRNSSDIQVLAHYLMRAVKFKVLKYIRDEKLHSAHLNTMERIVAINNTENAVHYNETSEELRKAIDELPLKCKEVFELSRFEQLSHKEISLRLNISTKTIEAQIGKALAILRQKLNRTL